MVLDITILMTYYNTPEVLFLPALEAVVKHNLPVVIVNDMSNAYYTYLLHEHTSQYNNVTVYDMPFKGKQAGATYYGLKRINSKFVMRVDSDDILHEFPNVSLEGIDGVVNINVCSNLNDWLSLKNASINGCIIKKDLLLYMYEDWELMFSEYGYYHEDAYTVGKLFLKYQNLSLISMPIAYTRNIMGAHKDIQTISRTVNRVVILSLLSTRYEITPVQFNSYTRQLIGENNVHLQR